MQVGEALLELEGESEEDGAAEPAGSSADHQLGSASGPEAEATGADDAAAPPKAEQQFHSSAPQAS